MFYFFDLGAFHEMFTDMDVFLGSGHANINY